MKTIEKNSLKTLLKLEKNTYDWYNFCANIEEIEGILKIGINTQGCLRN